MGHSNVNGNASQGKNKSRRPPSEKSPPGIFSRFLFCWMWPMFYYGNRRDLDENDLVPPKRKYDSKPVGDLLEK